jgi:hypothetical protein
MLFGVGRKRGKRRKRRKRGKRRKRRKRGKRRKRRKRKPVSDTIHVR